ncbi:hypothetical protein NC99_08530 [Sunxiuqinia dokdonensis]|uniref:Uncharacterized protein n=1 Tax=Sunxiuqinia dokdonensis TaxID=1409788 RepID=A0A0L8VCY6_9BACT|nr:hypothetical protein NC99_08530 [Sunxiuqinia dokdonensis]
MANHQNKSITSRYQFACDNFQNALDIFELLWNPQDEFRPSIINQYIFRSY